MIRNARTDLWNSSPPALRQARQAGRVHGMEDLPSSLHLAEHGDSREGWPWWHVLAQVSHCISSVAALPSPGDHGSANGSEQGEDICTARNARGIERQRERGRENCLEVSWSVLQLTF